MLKLFVKKVGIVSFLFIFMVFNFAFANDLESELKDVKVVTLYGRKTTVDEMDSIKFGNYKKDSDGTMGAIEWLVLENDEENHKALLLSKYIIDCKCFNDEYDEVLWDSCSLREWLNKTFYNEAFSDEEKKHIILSEVPVGNNITKDYIYLLDTDDIKKYFNQFSISTDNPKLATYATEYAKSVDNMGTKLWVRDNEKWSKGNSYFFLRERGVDVTNVSAVGSGGNVYGGLYDPSRIVNVNEKDGGVRPLMWVIY